MFWADTCRIRQMSVFKDFSIIGSWFIGVFEVNLTSRRFFEAKVMVFFEWMTITGQNQEFCAVLKCIHPKIWIAVVRQSNCTINLTFKFFGLAVRLLSDHIQIEIWHRTKHLISFDRTSDDWQSTGFYVIHPLLFRRFTFSPGPFFDPSSYNFYLPHRPLFVHFAGM